MAHRQFQLVAGRPALWWFDLFRRISYISILPFGIAAVAVLTKAPAWVIVSAVGAMFVINLGGLLSFRRVPGEDAELAAGYTTLYVRNQHVPQVDPETGVVIREEGEPLLVRRVPRGTQLRPTEIETPRPRRWAGRWGLLVFAGFGLVPLIAIALGFTGRNPALQVGGPLFVLVAFALVSLGVFGYQRSRFATIRSAYSRAFVFSIEKNTDLINGLEDVLGAAPAPVAQLAYVAVSDGLIRFVGGSPPQPFAVIDQAAVADAYLTVGRNQQGELASVVLVVRTEHGLVNVPMLLTTAWLFPTSDERSDEILAAVRPRR